MYSKIEYLTLKITCFMEVATVAFFPELRWPQHFSASFFEHRGKHEWRNAPTKSQYYKVYRDNLDLGGKYESRISYYWKSQSTA